MLLAFSYSAVSCITSLCFGALYVTKWNCSYVSNSMHRLNLFVISAFEELLSSPVASSRRCCCPFTEVYIFWRAVLKCFPLYCPFPLPKCIFSFPLQAMINDNKKLCQHWRLPPGTENICHFRGEQAEAPWEQCSCFQRCPPHFTNVSVLRVAARGDSALKAQSNTEIQLRRLSALQHAEAPKISCIQKSEA